MTLGVNWHPNAWLELRPELRGDFAGLRPAFRANGAAHVASQLTGRDQP